MSVKKLRESQSQFLAEMRQKQIRSSRQQIGQTKSTMPSHRQVSQNPLSSQRDLKQEQKLSLTKKQEQQSNVNRKKSQVQSKNPFISKPLKSSRNTHNKGAVESNKSFKLSIKNLKSNKENQNISQTRLTDGSPKTTRQSVRDRKPTSVDPQKSVNGKSATKKESKITNKKSLTRKASTQRIKISNISQVNQESSQEVSTPRFNKHVENIFKDERPTSVKKINQSKGIFSQTSSFVNFTLNEDLSKEDTPSEQTVFQANSTTFNNQKGKGTEPSFSKNLMLADIIHHCTIESFDEKLTEKNNDLSSRDQFKFSSSQSFASPQLQHQDSCSCLNSFLINEVHNLKQELTNTKGLLNSTLVQLSLQRKESSENLLTIESLDKMLGKLPKNKVVISKQSSKYVKAPPMNKDSQKYGELKTAFEKFIHSRKL